MSKTIVQPLNDCPVCNGNGEFHNETKEMDMDCPCIILKDMSDEDRRELCESYNEVLEGSKAKPFELPSNFMSLSKAELSDALLKMGEVHKTLREEGEEIVGEKFPTAVKWMVERGYDQLFTTEFKRMADRTVRLHS
jgi:hypothetical protein